MDKQKPKRQLTEEQLEKLAKARAKANEVRKKNLEIKKFEKENIKYEKEKEKIQKEEKREEAYNAVIELKKKREEPKEQPKTQPKKVIKPKYVKPEPEPEPEPENEEEPEEEEEYSEEEIEEPPPPPPRKPIYKLNKVPPTQTQARTRALPRRTEPTEKDLYDNANIELLRQRLYQQTRQRLQNDLFGY